MPALLTPRCGMNRMSGFTLIEMLVVVTIIGVLAAAVLGLYGQAKKVTWKQQTRNMTRQLAQAWKMRLQDDQAWPTAVVPDTAIDYVDFLTSSNNMAALNLNPNGKTNTYFEITAAQMVDGVRDHWGNHLHVRLDADSNGQVPNPADSSQPIYTSVAVWSTGPNPGNTKDWVVSY